MKLPYRMTGIGSMSLEAKEGTQARSRRGQIASFTC